MVVAGDAAATTSRILGNELRFRVGLVVDLAMFAGVVILSLALYVIPKTVDRSLALLALLWRMMEAVLGGVTVLAGLLVVLLLNGGDYFTVFEPEQVEALVDLFLGARSIGFSVVIFYLCLGTIVFSYLLFRSRYIPRSLAAFGIVSFSVPLGGSLVSILAPHYAEVAMISYGPGILFEVVIGIWLLVRGVDLQQGDSRQLQQGGNRLPRQ